MTGQSPREVEDQFIAEAPLEGVDTEYFRDLLRNIPRHVQELDDAIAPILDRPLAQLDPVERAILRIGTFELTFRKEVPCRVVINEAIELAKAFPSRAIST
jgi:N utilization substance protein B